jgi:hypothetical protein
LKGIVKIVSSECDAYPTDFACMVEGHLANYHELWVLYNDDDHDFAYAEERS